MLSSFKEENERQGWERLSQHRKPGVWALVKEFYSNLGEQRNLTCYVKGGGGSGSPLGRGPSPNF